MSNSTQSKYVQAPSGYIFDPFTPSQADLQRAGTHTAGGYRAYKPSRVRARAMRWFVLERDGHTCQMCGDTDPHLGFEIDHIIPYSAGGHFVASNLQVLCQRCNVRKGVKIL